MSAPAIGNYRIERLLGTGSFATVWLAWDPDLERHVAIKILAENWAVNDDVRKRFIQEARILWRLDHPRIIRVFTTGTLNDGRPYFVMDYADAGSLLDRIRERKERKAQFGISEAINLSQSVADGLIVAHSRGIIHRDLKPSNILFSKARVIGNEASETSERLMLADFGIARQIERASHMTIAVGTPFYMAPEQAEPTATRGPSQRSDIYSAATILYELLAGEVPYPFDTISQILRALESRERQSIRSVRSDVPEALIHVIDTGLEPDPDRRYASARAWKDALGPFALEQMGDDASTQIRLEREDSSDDLQRDRALDDRRTQERDSLVERFTRLPRSQQFGAGIVVAILLILGALKVYPHPSPAAQLPTVEPTTTITPTLQPSPEPTEAIFATAMPTMSPVGTAQLTNTFALMQTFECQPGTLVTGTDAVYRCFDSGYQVVYSDYVSSISVLLAVQNVTTMTGATNRTWHYASSPNIPEGDFIEYVDQQGLAELFWTIYGTNVSGRAIAPDSNFSGLENWWSTVANVSPSP